MLTPALRVLWLGARHALGFVLLLVILVLGSSYIGAAAQSPFESQIANSDLVPADYRGRIGAFVDASRWTAEVRERMFADSAGWLGVWRPSVIGLFVAAAIGGGALGIGLVILAGSRRPWIMSLPIVLALAMSLWALNAIQWGRAHSPSTGNYASVLAGERVGTPIGCAAAVLITAGVMAGGLLALRRQSGRIG